MFPTFRIQADVAQLVEQLIRNQQVTGSSPVVGSIYKWFIINNLTVYTRIILRCNLFSLGHFLDTV
jgi:hypothetical protein